MNIKQMYNYETDSSYVPRWLMDWVWGRDMGMCEECNTKEDLCFDHIKPRSRGGKTSYRNLQLLCQRCNLMKSDKELKPGFRRRHENRLLKRIRTLEQQLLDKDKKDYDELNDMIEKTISKNTPTMSDILTAFDELKEYYGTITPKGRPKGSTTGSKKKEKRDWVLPKVANALGYGPGTLKKILAVRKYKPQLLNEIDLKKLSIGKAYEVVRDEGLVQGNGGRPRVG